MASADASQQTEVGKPARARAVVLTAWLVAIPVALAAIWTVFDAPWWENHDMLAYPVRLIEYSQSMSLGNLFPRWCPDLYGGYGSPLFNFYAPGMFMIAGPMHLLGAPPALALKLTVWFFTTLGFAGTYLLTYAITQRRDSSLLALGLTAQTPYHFIQLLTRGDLAEYCAIALVPFAMLGYLRLRRSGPTLRRGLVAAGWHASILLTHTITGFWFTLCAAGVVLVWVVYDLRARRWIVAATAVVTLGGGLGITSIYTLPAMFERDLVRISIMTEGGFAIEKNFVGELKYLLSPSFFFAGYPLAITFVVALAMIAASPAHRAQLARWTGASLVIVLLMLPITAVIWDHLPFARFTQFPWRLLGFLGTLTALSGALSWNAGIATRTRLSDAILMTLLALVGFRAYAEMPHPAPLGEERVPINPAMVASQIQSTTVSDEYLPLTAPEPPRRHRAGLVHDYGHFVQVEDIRRAGIGFHVTANAEQPGAYFDLAQHWFPRWATRRSTGPAVVKLDTSPAGMIRMTFPKAGHYEVYVGFAMSPVRVVGLTMTIIGIVLLPLLLWLLRRASVASAA